MTRCYFSGGVHPFPVEDETGVYCPDHGVTMLWRGHASSDEGDRMTTTMNTVQADDGKHGGPPSDQPWPVPQPAPSPDGSRPQKHHPQS